MSNRLISGVKSGGVIYGFIFLSFVIASMFYSVYIRISGIQTDTGPINALIFYIIWGVIASCLSFIFYRIIFLIVGGSCSISKNTLIVSLTALNILGILIWGYADTLLLKGQLAGRTFWEFGFYNAEYLLLTMHFIYYLIVAIFLHVKNRKSL